MKTALPWLLVFVLIVSHLIRSRETREPETSTVELDKIQHDRDSLQEIIRLKTDTIQVALHVIESKDRDVLRAEEHRKQQIRDHEKNHFKPLVTDARRDSVLGYLYISFKN